MKRPPPETGASNDDLARYVSDLHRCQDDNFLATNWKNWAQMVGLFGVLITLAVKGTDVVTYIETIDKRVAVIESEVSSHSGRLDAIGTKLDTQDVRMRHLEALTERNSGLLGAASSRARERTR